MQQDNSRVFFTGRKGAGRVREATLQVHVDQRSNQKSSGVVNSEYPQLWYTLQVSNHC